MMIIKIANLSEGVHTFNFDEPVEKIGLDEEFKDNIKVNAALTKAAAQIILNVDLSVPANFECDRCVTEFETVLTNNYQMVYLYGQGTEDDETINVTYLSPEADRIDISEDVRDYAILAVPMKKLCKEECKGLCYKCGANLNEEKCDCPEDTDPRWKPLIDIKNKFDNN